MRSFGIQKVFIDNVRLTECAPLDEWTSWQAEGWDKHTSLPPPKFLGAGNHASAKLIPESLPRVRGHIAKWVDAILGGPEVFADLDPGCTTPLLAQPTKTTAGKKLVAAG